MPGSPSVAIHDATNLVENDGECGSVNATNENDTDATMNSDGINAASILDSSIADPQRSSSVRSSSVPINGIGNASDSKTAVTSPNYQHQNTPLSIISGLLPAVGLRPMTRNDSKYSGTTSSLASGLQRSQNSSRDWGWFEDVHHSDIASVATGGESSRATMATSRSLTNKTLGIGSSSGVSQQQTLTGARNTNSLHSSGGNSTKNNSGEGTMGGTNLLMVTDSINSSGSTNKTVIEGGTIGQSDSSSNRGEQRDRISQQNPVSLLPRGEEKFIDDMEEYLEPFLIHERPRDMENEAAVNANSAPTYVLEESISDQLLWKETAGNRPPQPAEERAYFEAMWANNFANSEVEYEMPTEVLTATTPFPLNPFDDGNFGTGGTGVIGAGVTAKQDVTDIVSSFVVPGGINASGHASGQQNLHLPNHHSKPSIVRNSSGSGGNLTVYAKGDNVFGTTVSKSFARPSVNGELVMGVDTVNISVASYRVVESEKRGRHAQFLVIYREGGVRDTIGVWKRYSDFQELSKKVTNTNEGCASVIANMSPLAVTEEPDVEHLPNAITSWHLLKKRKRWYRCLDSGYLSLKAFLLERFLHDILFESSTPDLLRDFVGVPPPR